MDAATAYLMALLTGGNAPPLVQTDPAGHSASNPVSSSSPGVLTKSWPMLPGTPVAGTLYHLETEFTCTWEANAMAFAVQVGTVWTTMAPSVGAPSFSTGTVAGWLRLTVRVQSATTARFALTGAIAETASSWTPGSGTLPIVPLSQTLTVAAGDGIAVGCYFGASNASQGVATYGSTWTVTGGQA